MKDTELIAELAARLDREIPEVESLLDAFGQVVADRLTDNDIVVMEGWGQFELKKKLERYTADAESGKRYLMPPKLIPVFRPATRLKTYIKNLDQA
ncbi:DNA-binding protein [Tannerella sp. oral taxon 808]|nr:DNA-binding protein [Tannerella sp. oral taxon 808]PNE26682.1 DNA-binding protein [Tannerella sp. oral taxon 808]PNE29431.1 DNA-binding protein [Tannerella sp. oral taxon 808]